VCGRQPRNIQRYECLHANAAKSDSTGQEFFQASLIWAIKFTVFFIHACCRTRGVACGVALPKGVLAMLATLLCQRAVRKQAVLRAGKGGMRGSGPRFAASRSKMKAWCYYGGVIYFSFS
jgi:hypothetical protein